MKARSAYTRNKLNKSMNKNFSIFQESYPGAKDVRNPDIPEFMPEWIDSSRGLDATRPTAAIVSV